MNRRIQLGDYVKITVSNQSYIYVIDYIFHHTIYIGTYQIYYNGNEWKVFMYNLPHTVEFIAKPEIIKNGFTEIYDTDSNILLFLDYKSLLTAFCVNKFINSIQEDELFWKRKVKKDYGVSKYKPENETYKKQYDVLFLIKTPNQAVDDDRLDSLIYYENENKLPDVDGANIAAENGNLDMILWLEKKNISPDEYGMSLALGNGRTGIVDYGLQKNIFPAQQGVNIATQSGDVELMRYCINMGQFPSTNQINAAAGFGHLELLQLLAQHNRLPDINGLNRALKDGHLDIAKWIHSRGIQPGESSREQALWGLHYNSIKWLITDFGIMPKQPDVDFVCRTGQMVLSRLLGKYKLYPTVVGLNFYCGKINNTTMLKWMKIRGIYPSIEGANKATKFGKNKIVLWLLQNNIFPEHEAIDWIMKRKKMDTIDILLSYNIKPSQKAIDIFFRIANNDEVDWLRRNHLR